MAVLGMLTFMAAWNGFFWPVIALNSANVVVFALLGRQIVGGIFAGAVKR